MHSKSSQNQRALRSKFLPFLLSTVVVCSQAKAATITWSFASVPHTDLSPAADVSLVSTMGDGHDAVNAGGGATTVNGVLFADGVGVINRANSTWSVPNVNWGTSVSGFYATNASTLGNAGDTWLNSAKYYNSNGAVGQLNMLNLTQGHQYQVQLFFADIRTVYAVDGRTVSLDGGATKTRFSFAPAGGPYGYLAATGVFTADSSSQAVNMQNFASPASGGAAIVPQINAYQIRDITSVQPSPPTILTQPFSRTAVLGDTISLTVSASGEEPMTYQWYFKGNAIAAAEDKTLILTNLAATDVGDYMVIATNSLGSTTSDNATITIVDSLDPVQAIEAYHPVWNSPSVNDHGAMPLGNGEVGLMLWVEADGDLQFYLSRTDSRTELDRLVKLGKVRLGLSPNPFASGKPFRQELRLRDGRAEIQAGPPENRVTLQVFVDSDSQTVYLSGTASSPLTVSATYETWRDQDYTGNVGSSALAGSSFPNLYESADVVVPSVVDRLSFYHRNAWSCVAKVAEVQFMDAHLADIPDTLTNRTFGGTMTLSGAELIDNRTLLTSIPRSDFELKLTTHTAQTATAQDWLTEVATLHAQAPDATTAKQRTAQWWHSYWDRSWLFVRGDGPPEPTPMGRNNHPLRIGADSNGSNLFSGSMARASFYGRVLDAAEIAALAAGNPDSDVTVTAGLTASWLLGSTTGGTCQGRLGTTIPLTATGDLTISSAGGVGHASFEGGHLQAIDHPNFEPASGVTMESWIRLDAGEANNGRLFDKTTANQQDGYLFDIYPGRALRLYNGFDGLVTAANIVPTGEWHHVLVTYDNATKARALYLDGVAVATQGGNTIGTTKDTPSVVTRGYLLTKWMSACGARGNFPIMFNGSLWTVKPNTSPTTIANNPDYRNWGHTYFYQNTRLNYLSMPARGELDFMKPFFDLYRSFEPLNRKRAVEWHGAGTQGQFNNEMVTTFGLLPGDIYGYNRSGKPKWYTQNQYGGAVTISPGLELLALMLDTYDHSGDTDFLESKILPYAEDLFRFIETRFPGRVGGLIQMSPLHSVETYHNTTNAMPVVAGMQAVLDRILALPPGSLSPAQSAAFTASRALTPPLPTQQVNGTLVFAPAATFTNSRMNVEEPEHYATFPFRLTGIGRPNNRQTAIDTFEQITLANNFYKPFNIGGPLYVNSFSGWQQTPMAAALLGRTADAKQALTANSRLFSSSYRLPAMWGQIYDSIPDGDHGANILNTAQLMAFQTLGDKIFLLPSWPTDWDVSFKFHAPHATTVSGRYRAGVLDQWEVTPASRAKDVVLMSDVPVALTNSQTVTGYDAWRLAQFSGQDLIDPALWDASADADGDGLANLIEFALGLDPQTSNPNPVRMEVKSIDGQNYLTLSVRRDPAATAVRIEGQRSVTMADSNSWSTAGTVVEVDSPTLYTIREADPIGSNPRSFLRLRFVLE